MVPGILNIERKNQISIQDSNAILHFFDYIYLFNEILMKCIALPSIFIFPYQLGGIDSYGPWKMVVQFLAWYMDEKKSV